MKAAVTKLQAGTSISITSNVEFVFLTAHSSLLNLGLTPIQEIPSSVPGFAPSLKGNEITIMLQFTNNYHSR